MNLKKMASINRFPLGENQGTELKDRDTVLENCRIKAVFSHTDMDLELFTVN